MPQVNFELGEEEDEKVIMYSKKWNLNKPKTINKIIKLFEEKEDANVG